MIPVYGAVPPVIIKVIEPSALSTDDGFVVSQLTPKGSNVITLHWFCSSALVVVVVV